MSAASVPPTATVLFNECGEFNIQVFPIDSHGSEICIFEQTPMYRHFWKRLCINSYLSAS